MIKNNFNWMTIALMALVCMCVTACSSDGNKSGGSFYVGEAIDLGLSVKWASCNVGANTPEGFGGYYAWGETAEKEQYGYESYKYADTETSYQNIGANISGTKYDVAHALWGGKWRMPTQEEFQELIEKCSWSWTTLNGINGIRITGSNGNSIFLPAGGRKYGSKGFRDIGENGCYWSATAASNVYAQSLAFSGNYIQIDQYTLRNRANGMLIRPVLGNE